GGPRARAVGRDLGDDDWSSQAFPYFTARPMTVGHVPVLASRLSYVGEPGWELYAPTEYGLALWDALWRAGQGVGIAAAGLGAFESLRLGKGDRPWGAGIPPDHNPYAAGLRLPPRPNNGAFP